MQTHTYRGFEIETGISDPTEKDGVPELQEAVQVIGRRDRIEIVETPPLNGQRDAQLREEIGPCDVAGSGHVELMQRVIASSCTRTTSIFIRCTCAVNNYPRDLPFG
jgi:hypothetical protein